MNRRNFLRASAGGMIGLSLGAVLPKASAAERLTAAPRGLDYRSLRPMGEPVSMNVLDFRDEADQELFLRVIRKHGIPFGMPSKQDFLHMDELT